MPEQLTTQSTRLAQAFRKELLAGLRLSTYARCVAIFFIGLLVLVQNIDGSWQNLVYFEGIIAIFGILGITQYRLTKSRFDHPLHKYLFSLADVCLLAFVIFAPPPGDRIDMSIAMQLRVPNFLYFFILMASAVLSYSPRLVLWNGLTTAAVWSAGVWWIIAQPEVTTLLATGNASPGVYENWVPVFLAETFVNVMGWVQEVVTYLIFSGIMAAVVWRARRLVSTQATAERERANLSRYFSPNMVEELANTDEPLGAVRRQDAGVLFADIVGFTGMSEHAPPEEVIGLLREFHGHMENCVFHNDGTLDKYLGDGVMATFGTPRSGPRDAANALACAHAMLDEIAQWNRTRAEAGHPAIDVGIGVHYGPVVLGDTGGDHRLEFAVIGDTVNVASRLERLTRETDSGLIASDDLVASALEQDANGAAQTLSTMTKLAPQRVRGRDEALELWGKP